MITLFPKFWLAFSSVAALILAPLLSLAGGVTWGLLLGGLLGLLPRRQTYFFSTARTTIGVIQWCFYSTWVSVCLSIVFGSWIFFTASSRYWLWAVLFLPVMFVQCPISYFVPILSISIIRLRVKAEPAYRFLALGTWWGDRIDFQDVNNGDIEMITSTEFHTIYLSLNLQKKANKISYIWGDGVLIGRMPDIINVRKELTDQSQTADKTDQSQTADKTDQSQTADKTDQSQTADKTAQSHTADKTAYRGQIPR